MSDSLTSASNNLGVGVVPPQTTYFQSTPYVQSNFQSVQPPSTQLPGADYGYSTPTGTGQWTGGGGYTGASYTQPTNPGWHPGDVIPTGYGVRDGQLYNLDVNAGKVSSLEDTVRNDINSGYNDYFNQLDQIASSFLPSQRSAQEGIAQSQGDQAQNNLTGQYNQGVADLAANSQTVNTNKENTLQNLANDIRNQFKAGQIYLGARGAGDSSAANQYAYAIAKMGNQARGGVLNQVAQIQQDIANKKNALTNTYNTEVNNIKEQVNQKMLGIAQWFADAQTQLQQAKAQGQLSKGQDLANLSKQLLQNATQQLMMAQQDAYNRRAALEQWAANNSTSIQGLMGNLAALSGGTNLAVNQPNFSGSIQSDNQGNFVYAPTGFRSGNNVWSDTSKWPVGTFTGQDGKTYTKYSDGSSGPTQWTYGK